MAKTSDNVELKPEELTQERLRKENEYVIKNKRVRRQSRRRTIVIILLIFLLAFAILAGATYLIMRATEENTFRISVSHTGSAYLSLSKDYNFTDPTTQLDVSAPKNLDNCSLRNYIEEQLHDIAQAEGTYENIDGDYYFVATTFYLKNTSETDVNYSEAITLARMKKGMEKAIRVLVIKDTDPTDGDKGVITVYAAPQSDADGNTIVDENSQIVREAVVPINSNGNRHIYDPRTQTGEDDNYEGFRFNEGDFSEDGEWLAQPFYGEGYVMKSDFSSLAKGQIIKYTVVIWLEGNDAQCVDDILGGQVKIAAEFTTEGE